MMSRLDEPSVARATNWYYYFGILRKMVWNDNRAFIMPSSPIQSSFSFADSAEWVFLSLAHMKVGARPACL